jgi:hypothetical protein
LKNRKTYVEKADLRKKFEDLAELNYKVKKKFKFKLSFLKLVEMFYRKRSWTLKEGGLF